MIDYEQLKLIHELTNKIDEIDEVAVQHHFSRTRGDKFILWTKNGVAQFTLEEMDELIAELNELIEPKAKQERHKEAWYLNSSNQPKSTLVANQDGYASVYETASEAIGKTMYPTKADLIEAQIEHWRKRRLDYLSENSHEITFDLQPRYISNFGKPAISDIGTECNLPAGEFNRLKKCQHECDGCLYDKDLPTFHDNGLMKVPEQYKKCNKCGEFYK